MQVWLELGSLAASHIEASDGKLALLNVPYPEAEDEVEGYFDYLDRQLDHHLHGSPIAPSAIENVATLADKRYRGIQDQVDLMTKRESHSLEIIAQRLRAGDNIILATNHGDLVDIALVFAAMNSALSKSGHEDLVRDHMRKGIIVSQIISRIGLNLDFGGQPEADADTESPKLPPTAAADALKMLCHDVWKSYPHTPSLAEMRERLPRMIGYHNKRMIMSVHHALGKGGLFLAMAPSGSKDRPSHDDPDTIALNQLGDRTIEMMRHDNTYTLFAAAWLQGTKPLVALGGSGRRGDEVLGVPTRIETNAQAHRAMAALSCTLEGMVPGKRFVYKKPTSVSPGMVRPDY